MGDAGGRTTMIVLPLLTGDFRQMMMLTNDDSHDEGGGRPVGAGTGGQA